MTRSHAPTSSDHADPRSSARDRWLSDVAPRQGHASRRHRGRHVRAESRCPPLTGYSDPSSTGAGARTGAGAGCLRLIRLLRDPARRPERWQQPSFGEEVELIRRHLAPVRSRRTLAASYGREAFHLAPTMPDHADPSATRLACAPLVGAPRWGDRPVLAVPAELERRRATPPASSADPVRTSTYKK